MGGVTPIPSIRQCRHVLLAADVKFNTLMQLRRDGVAVPEATVSAAKQKVLNARTALDMAQKAYWWKWWDR